MTENTTTEKTDIRDATRQEVLDDLIHVLTCATPEDNPYVDDPQAAKLGPAFMAIASATADLVKTSIETGEGLAPAAGILGALSEIVYQYGAAYQQNGDN